MGAPRLDKLDKNYIINGNFDFWQRAAGAIFSGTGTANGYAWADRFSFTVSTTNNRSNRAVNRSTDVPTLAESGFRSTYSMEYSQSSALALVGADYLMWCRHKIEGIFYRNLHGKTLTLSFWFKSTLAGQYPVAFQNGNNNRSYVTLFTYDVANVWQRISITLNTDAGGTWLFDSNSGLDIMIASDTAGTFDAPSLDTWVSGNYFGTSSGVQVQAQTSITMRIAQLQLIEGDLQSESFSMAGRGYAEELRLCQRYYTKTYDLDIFPGAVSTKGVVTANMAPTNANTACTANVPFPVRMKSNPVITLYNPSTGGVGTWRDNGGADISVGFTDNGTNGTGVSNNGAVTTFRYCIGHVVAEAEL